MFRREDRDGTFRAAQVLDGKYADGPDLTRRSFLDAVAVWNDSKEYLADALAALVDPEDAADVRELVLRQVDVKGFVRGREAVRLVLIPHSDNGSTIRSGNLFTKFADEIDEWNRWLTLPWFARR